MKGRESGMPEEVFWDTFFTPECMLTSLDGVGHAGDIVEFGCGYGTFTLPAARKNSGRVLALDIEPDMVALTARKAQAAGLGNVEARVRDFMAEGSGAAEGTAVYAMLFNILHLEDPVRLLRETYRVLAPQGKAAVVHWRTDIATPRGPSLAIRPTADQCRDWGEQANLEFVRYVPLACCAWHWGLILRRPGGVAR